MLLLLIMRLITPRTAILHPVAKNQGRITSKRDPLLALIFPVIIHEDDVKRMEVARDVTEKGEQDVDEEIGATACYEEYTERRDEDRDYDQTDETEDTHVA